MEEEEDKAGLKDLIKQHKLRPSYARMISWEFSKTDSSHGNKPRQRRRSKKDKESSAPQHEIAEKQGEIDMEVTNAEDDEELSGQITSLDVRADDDADNDCSSESEYHSAEETLQDSESNSLSLSVSNSDSDTESSVFGASFRTCSTFGEDQPDQDRRKSDSLSENTNTRKRAPSKKQKRKNKKFHRNDYFLEDLPFANFQEYEFLEDLGDEDSLSVQKPVPSLLDLCIRACRKLDSKARSILPRSIHHSSSHLSEKFYMEKIQLSWTYQALEDVENNMSFFRESSDMVRFTLRRNVWNVHHYQSNNSHDTYRGHPKSFFLPFTHAIYYERIAYKFVTPTETLFVMSVLATTVDLMLPQTVYVALPKKPRRRHESAGEMEYVSSKILCAVERVKAILMKRYPHVTGHLFYRVLPYVFWARGNVTQATNAFRKLIDQENRLRLKAMYVYEIGRLHSMFDDQSKALDCVKESTELLFTKPKYMQEPLFTQLTHQCLLLKANFFDQGLMSSEKARQAESAWMACVLTAKDRTFEHLDPHFMMDSFMCYHASWWKDPTKSWSEEAMAKLQMLCKDYPWMYNYQAMLYALEGKEEASSLAYREFRRRSGGDSGIIPGQSVKEADPYTKTAWRDLALMVKSQKVAPSLLQVLWRTQLSPPRLYNRGLSPGDMREAPEPVEADTCSAELNLRFSRDGYVTGDMMLLLPPIRGVYLNPHTGSVVLPQIPGETEDWKSPGALQLNRKHEPSFNFLESDFIAHLTELYSDIYGNTVSLLYADIVRVFLTGKTKPICQLQWKGPNGPRAKLNVVFKAREWAYNRKLAEVKSTPMETQQERLTLIKQCFDKGWQLVKTTNYDDISNYLRKKYPTGVHKSKYHRRAHRTLTSTKKPFKGSPFKFNLLKPPVVFGKTIVLCIEIDMRILAMFVRLENRQDFLEPVIVESFQAFHQGISYGLPKQLWATADVLPVNLTQSIKIYDKYGEEFDVVDSDQIEKDIKPMVIRSNFYYVSTHTGFLTCKCNGNDMEVEMYGPVKKFYIFGEMLVLLCSDGVRFVEAASLMQIPTVENSLSPLSIPLVDGVLYFTDRVNKFCVLGEKIFKEVSPAENFMRGALAIDNHLVILKGSTHTFGRDIEDFDPIVITASIALSGQAQDVCFLSESAGYLVSVSQFIRHESPYHRENLYHISHGGQILGVLPNLGPGPRSFLPRYYAGEVDDSSDGTLVTGWRVYMRDGHDGIICVRLNG